MHIDYIICTNFDILYTCKTSHESEERITSVETDGNFINWMRQRNNLIIQRRKG